MISASAIFCKPGSDKINGYVSFTQFNKNYVRVDIKLNNVPIGIHGIHIHEKSIKFYKNVDYCQQALGHFNGQNKIWTPNYPSGTQHGSFMLNTERHIGDLCNNIISIDGNVNFSYNDYLINLIPNHPNCIINRSVIIHENKDDEGLFPKNKSIKKYQESKITGNAGSRIACANVLLDYII